MKRDRIKELLSRPVISVPEAGELAGLSRNGAYAAAANGDLPTIKFGRLIKVPTKALAKLLHLDTQEVA